MKFKRKTMIKNIFLTLIISLFFVSCSSKDNTLIDTKTQQKNAKEALKEL